MDIEEFNHAARILGRKYVPAVLKEVSAKRNITASELASYIGICTATAVNYLTELEKIGVLKRRVVKGETGDVWEYQLASDTITLETEMDLDNMGVTEWR